MRVLSLLLVLGLCGCKSFGVFSSDENPNVTYADDAESNIEQRKQKLPAAPQNGPKNALLVEFKADGTDKTKPVLGDVRFHELALQATSVWRATPNLIITQGSNGGNTGRIWPVVITLSGEVKK